MRSDSFTQASSSGPHPLYYFCNRKVTYMRTKIPLKMTVKRLLTRHRAEEARDVQQRPSGQEHIRGFSNDRGYLVVGRRGIKLSKSMILERTSVMRGWWRMWTYDEENRGRRSLGTGVIDYSVIFSHVCLSKLVYPTYVKFQQADLLFQSGHSGTDFATRASKFI